MNIIVTVFLLVTAMWLIHKTNDRFSSVGTIRDAIPEHDEESLLDRAHTLRFLTGTVAIGAGLGGAALIGSGRVGFGMMWLAMAVVNGMLWNANHKLSSRL